MHRTIRSRPRQELSWDRRSPQKPWTPEKIIQEVRMAYMSEALLEELAKQVGVGHQRLFCVLLARDTIFQDQSPTKGCTGTCEPCTSMEPRWNV